MSRTIFAYGTTASVQLVAHWCNGCGIPYGLPDGFLDDRRKDHKSWTCPNGCVRHYPAGESDAEKLRKAEIRETALQDQLTAAIREGELHRQELLRMASRISKGVCPCCNRSFTNVRSHMETQHPHFAHDLPTSPKFKCSCHREFPTYQGLRVHQGWARSDSWDSPSTSKYWSHLTVAP